MDAEVAKPPAQGQSDAECVHAVLSGQRERFAELNERYQAAVRTVVRGYIRDLHIIEDVTQEVFLSAFSALGTLKQPQLFLPWLLQIARHRAATIGQRGSKNLVPLTSDIPLPPPTEPVHERTAHVMEKVEQLEEPYRRTVILKYERNLSCKEIAEMEGVAVGTITSRLTRALLSLRNALQE